MAALAPFATGQELVDFSGGAVTLADANVAVAGVSRAIRRACGWHIWPSIPETVKPTVSGRYIDLPTLRVTAITSVTESGTVLATTDYRWTTLGRVTLPYRNWAWGVGDVVIVMTHGWEEDDDVADLKQLTLTIAARSLSSRTGATREQTLSSSISWALVAPGVAGGVSIMDHEQSMLAPYKIVTV